MTIDQAAEMLARTAHAGQTDKAGQPYIGHLRRVAAHPSLYVDEDARAVAWLHDLVEDRPSYAPELLDQMPVHIARSVLLLTKSKGEPDELYFARIKADPLALKVKLADIADNLSEARLAHLDADTQARLRAKYARALELLTPAAPREDALRDALDSLMGSARDDQRKGFTVASVRTMTLRDAVVDLLTPQAAQPVAVDWQPIETAPKDRPVWVRGWDWGKPDTTRHQGWAYWNGEQWQWTDSSETNIAVHLTDWLPQAPALTPKDTP